MRTTVLMAAFVTAAILGTFPGERPPPAPPEPSPAQGGFTFSLARRGDLWVASGTGAAPQWPVSVECRQFWSYANTMANPDGTWRAEFYTPRGGFSATAYTTFPSGATASRTITVP